jgi:hypothetical protein
MPSLRDKAREVFHDILEPSGPDESYGGLVPDFLKSHTHGFMFMN